MKERIHVMTFGLGGSRGYGDDFQVSGYSTPESFQKDYEHHYSKYDFEGAVFIDLREAVRNDPSLAFKAPMLNVNLPKGTVDPFDPKTLNPLMVKVFSESNEGKLAILSGFVGGLDYVATDLFVEWWRDHGARIGTVDHGTIWWED